MKNLIKIRRSCGMTQIFAIFLTFILASCSNLLEQKLNTESSSSSKNQNAQLVINLKSQSRYIAASDYELSEIKQWALLYTEEDVANPTTKAIAWVNGISSSSSPSLSYSKENQTLTINNIPSGTYTIQIEGSSQISSGILTSSDSTSSQDSIKLFGSASGVKISSDSSSTEIYVGLKKSINGSGTFSLTLTDSENQLSNDYSSLQITLRNIFNGNYYMLDPSGLTTNTLKFEQSSELSSNTSTVFILSNADDTTITSGFYLLSFYLNDSKRIYISLDKSIIEIADGIQTVGETEIFVSRIKNYYATNSDSLGNGLSKSSPANITTLLNKLSQNLQDEGEINIYVDDDSPEINIDSLENLKTKLLDTSKYISIYDKTNSQLSQSQISSGDSQTSETGATPSLMIANNADQPSSSSDASVSVDISGSLTFTSGEKTQALIDRISVPSDSSYKITLKNGASLKVSGDISQSFSGTLQLSLIQEDSSSNKTDNFAAYFTNPLFEFTNSYSSISTNKFEFYNSENQQESNWKLEQKSSTQTTYVYYLIPQISNLISDLAQDSANANITANFSGDSQTTYSSGNTIPWKTDTLEFTLSISGGSSSDETSNITNYAWFLDENLCENSSQTDLVKLTYNISNLKNTKTYDLSCYFVLDEKIYKSNFELKFEELTMQ